MRDPVCLMEVGLHEAGAMAVYDGRAWYICGSACQNRFMAAPAQYRGNVPAERLTVSVMGSTGVDIEADIVKRSPAGCSDRRTGLH